jgi:hypothetical protein
MSRRSSLTVALAALALAAPAAQARAIDPPLNTFSEQEQQVLASRGVGEARPVQVSAPAPAPAAEAGFDWGAAAVGGAAMGALALVAAGGLSVTARRRVPTNA